MKTVIVYGPQGCGKSSAAKGLLAYSGCTGLVDDWDGCSPLPEGALALTNKQPPYKVDADVFAIQSCGCGGQVDRCRGVYRMVYSSDSAICLDSSMIRSYTASTTSCDTSFVSKAASAASFAKAKSSRIRCAAATIPTGVLDVLSNVAQRLSNSSVRSIFSSFHK